MQRVQDLFSNPNLYQESYSDPVSLAENAIIKNWLRPLSPPVLDLGCGTGFVSQLLSLKPHQYIGIDQSSPMIDFGRRQQPSVRWIQTVANDFEAWPKQPQIRSIVSTFLFDYLPATVREQIIQFAATYLPQHGQFFFTTQSDVPYQSPQHFALNDDRLWIGSRPHGLSHHQVRNLCQTFARVEIVPMNIWGWTIYRRHPRRSWRWFQRWFWLEQHLLPKSVQLRLSQHLLVRCCVN